MARLLCFFIFFAVMVGSCPAFNQQHPHRRGGGCPALLRRHVQAIGLGRRSSDEGADELADLRVRLRQVELERDAALRKVRTLEKSLAELNDDELKALEGLGAMKRVRRSVDRSLELFSRRAGAWGKGQELAFVAEETQSTLRIVLDLLKSGQLFDQVLPAATSNPLLLSHSLSLYSRADRLEPFVPNIAPVLVDHLPTIEPHL